MDKMEGVTTMTKEQKAALKAQRRAEFLEKNPNAAQKDKFVDESKSKSQLKAERRAKQDAQRAAKTQPNSNQEKITAKPPASTANASAVPIKPVAPTALTTPTATLKETLPDTSRKVGENVTGDVTQSIMASKEVPHKFFAHLPYRILNFSEVSTGSIPSSVVQIGYRINKDLIKGSTAKCIAMLMAFKDVVTSHQLAEESQKDLKRDLQKILFIDCLKFLAKCRPLSISMNNAVKHLKLVFSRISAASDDNEVKETICSSIDTFVEEEIICSWKAIVDRSLEKINDGDTILTLGCSSIVKHILYNAARKGRKFKVIVVDTRPKFDAREMVHFCVKNNIPATYILINSISYVMKEVTSVIIEAHSLLANGYVMSHIGSSQVALVAKAYNIPVIVCCETYKFSDRVHTDCFVHNELGDDKSFFSSLGKRNTIDSSENPNLNVLDLLYDLTPHEFVSVVITEKGSLPCTSVPTILRVRETK